MILVLALLLAAQDPHDPSAELASFQLLEGYQANLFASEKDGIANPIQCRWDERGRLWVVCSWAYPQVRPGEKADDKVVVLEDGDGDGRADRSTVFAGGLHMPMGIELGHGGVYVGSATELLFLRDLDGDLKADERRVVLNGFGTGDSHQNINSFRWGPGGELWFCQGLHSNARVETPWGVEKLDKAGVWRLHPRRLRLDAFLDGAMGAHNPWGVEFDDWGQPIMVAGNGHGIYYMVPASIRTDHFLTLKAIWTKGRKFCGADIVGTRHLPEAEQGVLVAGGFMNNAVYRFRLADEAAGFSATELEPLVRSTHNAFRAVDVRVGPDGAIYVADWYNPVIGHYQASFRHPDRDVKHGRIWRFSAKGRPRVERPPLETMDAAALAGQLRSPERWVRYQAKRLLAALPAREAAEAVRAWADALDPADPERERLLVEAIGVFESHEAVKPRLLQRLLQASDPRARAYGARVAGRWADRLENPLELLETAVRDEHPRVRLEAVVAATYVPSERAIEVAARAADRPMDAHLTYALTQAVHALRPLWRPAFDAGRLSFGNDVRRMQFVLTADGTKDALRPLFALLRGGGLSVEARANVLSLVAAVGGPGELGALLDDALYPEAGVLARTAGELEAAWRLRRVKPEGAAEAAARWAGHADPGVRAAAIRLAGAWGAAGLLPEIEKAARVAGPARGAAFEALADLGAKGILEAVAGSDEAYDVRRSAAAALARADLAAAARVSARLLASEGDPSALVAAFLSRSGGAEALAAALEGKSVQADAARLALRVMGAQGREDKPLWDLLQKAAGISGEPLAYDAGLVKQLAEEARTQGDPARGEAVFRSSMTNCLSCHAIGGAGGQAGPELGEVGTALPADLLIESVLWPNRQVKENFTSTLVATDDGRLVQGYKVREDAEALVLRDPVADRTETIPLRRIERRKDVGSVMPEGVVRGLTRQELRDLVRFLSELGRPGPWQVTHAPLVRTWQVLEADGRWGLRLATVAGTLPLREVPAAGEGGSGRARFFYEVTRPGRFRIAARGAESVWVDGRRAEGPSVELASGRRELVLRPDRAAGALSCEVAPETGEGRVVSLR